MAIHSKSVSQKLLLIVSNDILLVEVYYHVQNINFFHILFKWVIVEAKLCKILLKQAVVSLSTLISVGLVNPLILHCNIIFNN